MKIEDLKIGDTIRSALKIDIEVLEVWNNFFIGKLNNWKVKSFWKDMLEYCKPIEKLDPELESEAVDIGSYEDDLMEA